MASLIDGQSKELSLGVNSVVRPGQKNGFFRYHWLQNMFMSKNN